jgi:DNA-binding CsgD family transcriptional regulator
MKDAASIGIRSGVSIPVTGGFGTKAAITFSSSEDTINETFVADQFSLLSIGAFLHAFLPHSDGLMFNAPQCPLTISQLETLSWLVQGKTSAELAQIRRVSDRAVEYQLHAIRHRLGANTTVQSVAIALDRHWISV